MDTVDVNTVKQVAIVVSDDGFVPTYGTEGAAGFDLYSPIAVVIPPTKVIGVTATGEEAAFNDPTAVSLTVKRGSVIIPIGVQMAIPEGCEMQIRPRSGLGIVYDIEPFPGTIDSDFRGDIKIKMFNNSTKPYQIQRGMRIAQGVIAPFCRADFRVDVVLPDTERGHGGLGHTGK